jgi:hypothetical protein
MGSIASHSEGTSGLRLVRFVGGDFFDPLDIGEVIAGVGASAGVAAGAGADAGVGNAPGKTVLMFGTASGPNESGYFFAKC